MGEAKALGENPVSLLLYVSHKSHMGYGIEPGPLH